MASKHKKESSKSKTKSKIEVNHSNDKEIIENDPRFASALSHPKFRKTKANQNLSNTAIELDERFSAVLTDERFSVPGSAGGGVSDKYGRKQKKKKKKVDDEIVNDELSAFYKIKKQITPKGSNSVESSSDDREEEDDDASVNEAVLDKEVNDSDDEPGFDDPEARIAYLNALARGEISCSSSSDDEDDDSLSDQSSNDSEDSFDEGDEYKEGILIAGDKIAPVLEITHDVSPYLAVLNMSWEHVRAVDLFVLLSSFCPPGSVKCVSVFPSDYGLERMSRDAKLGPQGIWKNNIKESEASNVNESFDESSVDSLNESTSSASQDAPTQDAPIQDAPNNQVESDFDAEKLRSYEALKLKYFFAVAEFRNSETADIAYKEIDGMELEHSSAALDLRSIPLSDIESVVKDRKLRDKATDVPSNYEPPDFIVTALQQTNVKCTWEDGDYEREKKLTQYGVGNSAWDDLAEKDDLRNYLASDASSDDGRDSDNDSDNENKGTSMRKLLGLGSDDDSVASPIAVKNDPSEDDDRISNSHEEDKEQEFSFVPKTDLEKKIRSKLNEDVEKPQTPWEKYLQKRKEKKREKREAKKKNKSSGAESDNNSLYDDNEPIPEWARDENDNKDDFFMEESDSIVHDSKNGHGQSSNDNKSRPSTKEELELLLAGDRDEEFAKDFDIRGLMRIEKNKDKKLRGKRKRKEEALAADVSGSQFKMDLHDDRFNALLDGKDDRFGIDRTDPNFKETQGMRELLKEQTKRRKKRSKNGVPGTRSTQTLNESDHKNDLDILVNRLKKNVKQVL